MYACVFVRLTVSRRWWLPSEAVKRIGKRGRKNIIIRSRVDLSRTLPSSGRNSQLTRSFGCEENIYIGRKWIDIILGIRISCPSSKVSVSFIYHLFGGKTGRDLQ